MTVSISTYFHEDTFTATHLVVDKDSGEAVIVDPVMDFDQKSGHTSFAFIDEVLAAAQGFKITYVLETHAHADHLSAGDYIRQQTGARVVIGKLITQVQSTFANIFNEGPEFKSDGHQFDVLVSDGDELRLGEHVIRVLATPGHTPACVSYVLNDSDVFVGDTLFMPDVGSARCDFPGGDAATLYQSVQKLLALGDEVMMHLCHDYPPEGRDIQTSISVAQQKADNIHLGEHISEAEFIAMRSARDEQLQVPRLILPSLQVNIRAGALPAAESNGVAYLKMPLNLLGK